MKSLNVVFTAPERVEVLEESVETLCSDEILCAAEKSLISIGTELSCLKGIFDPATNWSEWVQYPFHPGYGMASCVLEVGKEVRGIQKGDRIASLSSHNQYFKFKPQPQKWLKIPENISDEEAAWMSLACTAQLGVRRAGLKLGESVGIIGGGLLGQLVVQYLSISGARKIILIDPLQKRLDMALTHGATHILSLEVQKAQGPIREINGGKGLDIVFDITGSPGVLPVASTLVRPLGRVVLLGDSPTPSQQFLGPRIVADSISILGIHASMAPTFDSEFNPWTLNEMTSLFFEFLLQKRMKVLDLVTHRTPPNDAPKVYRDLLLDRSTFMGIIFKWK